MSDDPNQIAQATQIPISPHWLWAAVTGLMAFIGRRYVTIIEATSAAVNRKADRAEIDHKLMEMNKGLEDGIEKFGANMRSSLQEATNHFDRGLREVRVHVDDGLDSLRNHVDVRLNALSARMDNLRDQR
jgi:hypothetical protein